MRTLARRVIPRRWRQQVQRVIRSRNRLLYAGSVHHCPVCGTSLRCFLPFGERRVTGDAPADVRPGALCPVCGALERHRLIWLYFTAHTDLLAGTGRRMLHFAPEPSLEPKLRAARGLEYVTADLEPGRAMVAMDICHIKYPDAHFDVVYCSHVLEHVPDDRRAMWELRRVLKPGGWAVLQVPITAPVTFEDPTITTPEERERVFGQHDHVRRYGPDYADRLERAGFRLTRIPVPELFDAADVVRFGLDPAEEIFLCRPA
jgi:SAM-dependent methyltransferase